MIDFYNLQGGLYWWLFIRFCQTKLKDEQAEINKSRNLIFVSLLNMLLLVIAMILFYNYS